MATKYHTTGDGYLQICKAVVRKGQGVTGCPIEVEGVEVAHVVGLEGIAATGGGKIRKWIGEDTYRITEVVVLDESHFMTSSKLKRVYTMDGKLLPLEDRLQASRGKTVPTEIDAALDYVGQTYELSDADRVAVTSAYLAAVEELPIDKSILERFVQNRLVDNATKIAMAAPEELRVFFNPELVRSAVHPSMVFDSKSAMKHFANQELSQDDRSKLLKNHTDRDLIETALWRLASPDFVNDEQWKNSVGRQVMNERLPLALARLEEDAEAMTMVRELFAD